MKNEDAVREDITSDVTYALQQVVKSGSGTAAQALGRPVAGKTGTATNGEGAVSSAWFSGYTPQLATSVMYVRGKGNEQLQGWLPSYFGGAYPAETWTAVMKRAMEGLPVEDFPPPAFVDGDAPETGHEPYTPPPSPTQTQAPPPPPKSSKTPTQEPSEEPTTEEPTPTAPPSSPEDSCLPATCPSDDPSDSNSPGNGNNAADTTADRQEATRERYA